MRGRQILLRIIPVFAALIAVAVSLSGRPDRVALAVSCVPADDYETNQSTSEACPVTPGSQINGLQISANFVASGSDEFFLLFPTGGFSPGFYDIISSCTTPTTDEDWFIYNLQQGFDFTVSVNNWGESNGDTEGWVNRNDVADFPNQGGHYGLEIRDTTDAVIHSNVNTGTFDKSHTFTVPATGDYKVRIYPLTAGPQSHCPSHDLDTWGGDNYLWDYDLGTFYTPPTNPVVGPDPYEENDFAVAPYDISLPFSETDPTIYGSGDDDWFRFLGSPGGYNISAASGYGVDLVLELYGPGSTSVPIASATGTNPILTGTLTQSGFYLVRVDSVSNTAQTPYSLDIDNSASNVGEDSYEQNDTVGAARLISTLPASNLAATMYPANDPDFYLFAASAGTISASVTSQDSDQYTIRLYDTTNTQVATAGPSVNPAITNFTAPTAGNYKLEVIPASTTETGNYRFNISNTAAAGQTEDSFEQNDTVGTARLVTAPQNNTAATLYPANDPDFYLFAANPGTINVSATATDGDQYTINLLSPSNAVLASAGPSQNPSISNFNVTVAGNYKLEVVPATTTQTGSYLFSIATTANSGQNEDPYEQNDNAGSTYALTLPITLNNTTIFPVSDPDFFRFFSNAGTATINIYPNDSNMRFTVSLVNPDGSNNMTQTNVANPALNATLTQSGNYRIEIMEITGRAGGYTLSASYSQSTGPVAADPYEENDSYATPKQIGAVDNITTTTIFPASDPDYFQFFGTAGRLGLYLFAQNSNMNFTLRLYDPNGAVLQTSTGPNAAIVRDLTFQGYYTIEILETTGTEGKYLLNISNGPYPTPTPMGTPATPLPTQTPSPTPDMGGNPDIAENNNSWNMAFRIAPGNEIGALNFNGGWGVDDIDYFVMNVKKDTQYTCETYNLGLGTDTIMSIYGPTADTNNLIGTHDDIDSKNGDVRSKLTWKSAFQGQVYIVVDQVGSLTYPGAATYDFACDTGTSAGGSSSSSTTGGGGGGGGGTTGGATSGSNALSVEIIGAPERVAPPEPPPAGTLMINVLIAYDENANGLIDLQEGVLGMSVRAIDVSTNKQLSSGFTDSHGNLQLLISAPQGNDVMIVIPFLSVGKTFEVNENSSDSWRVLLPSSLLPGLIP